jgi:hypothetical protein
MVLVALGLVLALVLLALVLLALVLVLLVPVLVYPCHPGAPTARFTSGGAACRSGTSPPCATASLSSKPTRTSRGG